MIELIVIWLFIKRIGRTVAERGYKPIGYQVLLVIAWLSGETLGYAVGTMLLGEGVFLTYLAALIGGLGGGIVVHLIANRVPSVASGSESPGQPARLWSLGVPIGVSLLATMCACGSLTAAVLKVGSTVPPLRVSSLHVGSQVLLDQSIDPASAVTQHSRIVYLDYDLSTPDRNTAPVTIDWRKQGQVLMTRTTEQSPGHHLVTFDAAELPDGYLSPGTYQLVIRVDQVVLAEQPLVVE